MDRLLKKADGIRYQVEVICEYVSSVYTEEPSKGVKTTVKTLESKQNAIRTYRERYENIFEELCLEADSTQWAEVQEAYKEFQAKCTKADETIEVMLYQYFGVPEDKSEKTQDVDIVNVVKELVSAQMESFQKLAALHQESFKEMISSKSQGANEARLPKLDLKVFSGGYAQWVEFYDTFQCAVDSRKNLAPVQKLQYLKSCLKGEPAALLRNVTLNDGNYVIALNLLKDRYENPKNIREAHFDVIFDLPQCQKKTAGNLRKLCNVMKENLQALDNLGEPVSEWSSWLVYLTKKKLDADTRFEWEKHTANVMQPTFKHMMDFLSEHAFALEASEEKTKRSGKRSLMESSATKSLLSTQGDVCFLCSQDHRLPYCPQYTCLSPQERKSKVLSLKLCLNCFSRQHFVPKCPKPASCRVCNRKHHPSLHFQDENQDKSDHGDSSKPSISGLSSNQISGDKGDQRVSYHSTFVERPSISTKEVLLGTAIVYVHSRDGHKVLCRALIDPGSQSSFLTRGFVQRLRLEKQVLRNGVLIKGIGGLLKGTLNQMVHLELSSQLLEVSSIMVDALIIDEVTSSVPRRVVHNLEWPQLDSLPLADEHFCTPGPVDILLGADVYPKLFLDGMQIIKSPSDEMLAQESTLGWIITGALSQASLSSIVEQYQEHTLSHFVEADDLLKRFWEIEENPSMNSWSIEEKCCETHFINTTYRHSCGKYVVSLPFKENCIVGKSKDQAVHRLHQIERRFSRNPRLKEDYCKVMQEYFDLNHAEKVPAEEMQASKSYYMPHHCVIRESSSTTKLRVVFDASAKTSNGTSLNDCLMVGPKVQQDLIDILVRFRLHPVAFSADIAKMYRQVTLNEHDRDFHRFVWRADSSEDIQYYRMTTVTFGVASSAFHAQRVLMQLADDEVIKYPQASQIVKRDLYMDDCLSGASDVETAIKIQGELTDMLQNGGFELRKWAASDVEFMKVIPQELCEIKPDFNLDLEHSDCIIKTLGMHLFSIKDEFFFKVQPFESLASPETTTKRLFLSDSSRIFDPLGLLAPVLITAKILFQKLWLRGTLWDDLLPDDIFKTWIDWRTELSKLQDLKIPRCLVPKNSSVISYELHGFCDASEAAYAAAAYLRTVTSNGEILVRLVTAKTKVAPLKKISLPRLELCGALLLARLLRRIYNAFSLSSLCLFGWTDSTVTLSWIHGEPSTWKTFVGNRVSEIQDLVSPSSWHYCPSSENPADCASRGIKPGVLLKHESWYTGPSWLSELPESWPDLPTSVTAEESNKERKSNCFIAINFSQSSEKSVFDMFPFSSLSKVVRTLAWCLRWIHKYSKPVSEPLSGFLTTTELYDALLYLVKEAQRQAFSTEISLLKSGKALPTNSKILSLSPFIDDHDLLRVGGRLKLDSFSYSRKHPILLPKKHTLTNLIIDYEHKRNLHAGPQLLLASIHQKYWIIGGKALVRKFVHQCVVCRRQKAKVLDQVMGDLPVHRITSNVRAFLNTGVDYAGPVQLKTGRGRGTKTVKAWIALFVCFSVKAIHLELVSSLSSDAFLAALKRFVSRRGKPDNLYSDNGSNFVGANRELKEVRQLLMTKEHNDSVRSYAQENGIEWHFAPPKGSHFGGLWEAGVKSVKFHLRRIIGNVNLTFEELTTILYQIEACLNSRPLCPLSSDPSDFQALTPGHFLVMGPLNALPEPDITDIKVNRLSRWQHLQQLQQHFWKRWSLEYLSKLQQRPKWMTKRPNLKIDDLVILKEENLPPTRWIMGRVVQLHPGKDGCVRVVTVKTSTGLLKRPIVKLVLLLEE